MIYAENCCWSPADFAELRKLVDGARRATYRDGPNGDDFVYANDLISEREGLLDRAAREAQGEVEIYRPPRRGIVAIEDNDEHDPLADASVLGYWLGYWPARDLLIKALLRDGAAPR